MVDFSKMLERDKLIEANGHEMEFDDDCMRRCKHCGMNSTKAATTPCNKPQGGTP
jgi:hypothetical protein